MEYIVAKEKGGRYFVHHKDSKTPVPGSFGDKRHAIRVAATCEGITAKEYINLRKREGISNG